MTSTSTSTATEVFRYKFFAPRAYPGAVPRQNLIKRIFREPRYGIIAIQAPAGHGKSTLLQQAKSVAEERGARTAWLSFDDADNEPLRFMRHIEALVDSLGDHAGEWPEPGSRQRRRFASSIAARLEQVDGEVSLFFDEVQCLTDRNILAVLQELIEHLPDNVTIFLGARALPEIGLPRLTVNNHALVLRADDLRFSQSEAEEFFHEALDLGISRDEFETIYRQTEGWPAALHLFKLSLNSPTVRRSLGDLGSYKPRELTDYLSDNVLNLQLPGVQQFLRRTSVLRRLSADLCDYVTGETDSQRTLLFLERSGLFLRCLDSDHTWFKYHTLFSSYLIEQARGDERDALREVHQRAAEWLHRHAMHEDAFQHAIDARNYDLAADIMDEWAERLIVDGDLATVERWSDCLPMKKIEDRPSLAVKIAWALVFLRRHHKLRPILPILDRAATRGVDSNVVLSMRAVVEDDIPLAFRIVEPVRLTEMDVGGFRAFELGAAANLSGYRSLIEGDFDAAHDLCMVARAHNRRADAAFSGGYSVAVTGISLVMQGRLIEALSQYRTGLTEQHLESEKSFAAASLVSAYTHALYEYGDLDSAESMFLRLNESIADSVLLDFLALGYLAMARIQAAHGRSARTADVLNEAEQLAHSAGWPRLLRIMSWERVRQAVLVGDIDRAQALASRIPQQPEFTLPDGWMMYLEAIEGDTIGTLRLAVHSGSDSVLAQLSRHIDTAQRQQRIYRFIKLLILDTIAQHRHGNEEHARRSLHRALQLAAPQGFARLFLDEGRALLPALHDMRPLLERRTPEGDPAIATQRDFVADLLKAAGGSVETGAIHADSGFQPLEPLTERERRILVFLANGLSNKEMARRVFVSENTIKFHLKNIYSKLAVNSRLQAINAARQMGIIP